METNNPVNQTLLNERLVLDTVFLSHIGNQNSPIANRCYIEHHPRAYWDATDVYTLSIHCKANYSGDYYLHMSRMGKDDKWFLFLINGKWSQTFMHLRHITYWEELEEIVWALTRCKIFKSRFLMEEYCKNLPNSEK